MFQQIFGGRVGTLIGSRKSYSIFVTSLVVALAIFLGTSTYDHFAFYKSNFKNILIAIGVVAGVVAAIWYKYLQLSKKSPELKISLSRRDIGMDILLFFYLTIGIIVAQDLPFSTKIQHLFVGFIIITGAILRKILFNMYSKNK